MRDLASARWIKFKGILFLLLGIFSSALVIAWSFEIALQSVAIHNFQGIIRWEKNSSDKQAIQVPGRLLANFKHGFGAGKCVRCVESAQLPPIVHSRSIFDRNSTGKTDSGKIGAGFANRPGDSTHPIGHSKKGPGQKFVADKTLNFRTTLLPACLECKWGKMK